MLNLRNFIVFSLIIIVSQNRGKLHEKLPLGIIFHVIPNRFSIRKCQTYCRMRFVVLTESHILSVKPYIVYEMLVIIFESRTIAKIRLF